MDFVSLLSGVPKEIATFLIAMIPIGELRVSIPVALQIYNIDFVSAYLLSVFGNIFPVIFILLFLEPASSWLSNNFLFFKKFFTWLFERTRKKHTRRFEVWGALALITFVAIPLPFTGAWTGSVAAFVFGVPLKKSLPLIFLGVLIAGLIVTILTKGVAWIF